MPFYLQLALFVLGIIQVFSWIIDIALIAGSHPPFGSKKQFWLEVIPLAWVVFIVIGLYKEVRDTSKKVIENYKALPNTRKVSE